jgi:predicted outer membrane protein
MYAVGAIAAVALLHPLQTAHPGHDGSAADEPVVAAAQAADASADGLPVGWTMTPSGPLGPADRDLIVKVKLAGLWEMPAGQEAQKRGTSSKVRDCGRKIAAEHHELDLATEQIAVELGVPLPNVPNADQQGWLGEMAAARGAEFDRVFVDRLRAAHGKVFSVIAAVRAGTRNSAVRAFAATANAAVLRHMGYLESTGLVDFATLPTAPAPAGAGGGAPAEVRRTGLEREGGVDPLIIWILLIAAGVAAVATTARVVRAR